MRLILIVLLLFVASGLLLAFAPLSSPEAAKEKAVSNFSNRQQGRTDGCGFTCKNCGAKSVRKVPFGYMVKLEYACGILPSDEEKYHKVSEVFVRVLF